MKKFKIINLAVVLVTIFVCGMIMVGCNKNSKFQEQLNLGTKALLEMNYEEAVAAFANAIKINPKDVDAYLGITEAYVSMGDYGKASEYLLKGRKEIPNISILTMLDFAKAEDLVSLGNEFVAKGDFNLAYTSFEEALKKDPENEEAQKGLTETEDKEDESAAEPETEDSKDNEKAANGKSYIDFDTSDFTLFDLPVTEDHTAEWAAACGYTATDYSAQECAGYGYVAKVDRDLFIMAENNPNSWAPYIGYFSEPRDGYSAQINIMGIYAKGYEDVLDSVYDGPVEIGDSFEKVTSLFHYSGEIPVYNSETQENLTLDDGTVISYQMLKKVDETDSDKVLIIYQGDELIMIHFTNDVVSYIIIYTK